jgi:sugar phosphate permease
MLKKQAGSAGNSVERHEPDGGHVPSPSMPLSHLFATAHGWGRRVGVCVSFSAKQRQIFLVTWITYAGFYFCRKNLSIVLPALQGRSGLGTLQLANIVFGYTLLYVIGQFGCGLLSDRIGAKRVVGAGLLLVVGCNLLMGAHLSFLWLLLFACLNGLGQSTGWSGLVKIMVLWFSRANRGVVMAWWGTNYVLGGFIATAFATWAVTQPFLLPQLSWRRGFIFPAFILLAITLLFLSRIDGAGSDAATGEETIVSDASAASRSNWKDLGELLRKPSLWMVSISYFFLELCRYALMFWLPLYMVDHLRYSLAASGYISSLYELAGVVGAVIAGYASDCFMQSRRAPVSAVMLCAFGCLLLCQPALSSCGAVGIAVLVSLAGVFSYGPDTLLSGAGAQDIGEVKATATATGLIEGVGHLGALLSPYIVVFVSTRYGWNSLFEVFAVAAFLAGAVLMPIWNLRPQGKAEMQIASEVVQLVR